MVISFLEGDSEKPILEYFYETPNHSEHLIKHIYCKSISTTLSKFLNHSKLEPNKNNSLNLGDIGLGNTFNLNNGDEEKKDDKDLTPEEKEFRDFSSKLLVQRISIYKALVNRMLASTDLEVLSNIRDIFDEMYKNCSQISEFPELFKGIFCDPDTLDTMFKCFFSRGKRNRRKVIFSFKFPKIGRCNL